MLNGEILGHLLEEDESGSGGFSGFWNNPDFWVELNTSVVPKRGTGAPSFTRATTKTIVDFEGRVRTILAGEAGFTGARRVRNLLTASQDLTGTGWNAFNGLTKTATAATFVGSTSYIGVLGTGGMTGANQKGVFVVSFDAWANAAGAPAMSVELVDSADGSDSHLVNIAFTTTRQRYSLLADFSASSTFSGSLGFFINRVSLNATAGMVINLTNVQVEDVTGQSNQNPSEYVSVGVLSSPFQGANVDGVQYFATQSGNTVTSNVVTAGTGAAIGLTKNQSAYLPGVIGSYFSTPDGPVNSFTRTLDVDAYIAPADWSPSGVQELVSKSASDTSDFAFVFRLDPSGALFLYFSFDGTTLVNAQSSGTGLTDGTAKYARAAWDGVAGTVKFYLSPDGATWTQLGATQQSAAFIGTLFDSASPVRVGARGTATAGPFQGAYYRARMYNGLRDAGGTLAVDFNPQDASTASSTWASSTTGETWTKQGGASILNFPLLGYDEWQGSTNLCLQSENFGTTWSLNGTPTRVAGALRCGDVLLDLIGDDDVTALEGYNQVLTFTGDAVKALSIYFAQATATTSVYQLVDTTASTSRMTMTITWSGGVPTVTANVGTLLAVDALGNGVYRLRAATTTVFAANVNNLRVFPACDVAGTVGLTGTCYFGGVQAENNTFCTPYIATTTAAVTRNGDLLTYPSAGNASVTQGTMYAEWSVFAVSGLQAGVVAINDGSSNNRVDMRFNGVSAQSGFVGSGGVSQVVYDSIGALSVGVAYKSAQKWSATDSRNFVAPPSVQGGLKTMATPPASFTVIRIGSLDAGGNALNGNVRNAKIWQTAANDAYLTQATA